MKFLLFFITSLYSQDFFCSLTFDYTQDKTKYVKVNVAGHRQSLKNSCGVSCLIVHEKETRNKELTNCDEQRIYNNLAYSFKDFIPYVDENCPYKDDKIFVLAKLDSEKPLERKIMPMALIDYLNNKKEKTELYIDLDKIRRTDQIPIEMRNYLLSNLPDNSLGYDPKILSDKIKNNHRIIHLMFHPRTNALHYIYMRKIEDKVIIHNSAPSDWFESVNEIFDINNIPHFNLDEPVERGSLKGFTSGGITIVITPEV